MVLTDENIEKKSEKELRKLWKYHGHELDRIRSEVKRKENIKEIKINKKYLGKCFKSGYGTYYHIKDLNEKTGEFITEKVCMNVGYESYGTHSFRRNWFDDMKKCSMKTFEKQRDKCFKQLGIKKANI